MSLNQVTNIQDGEETFELWSNADGSDWEIRKPTPSPGDPSYSSYGILGSGGEGLDLTSPRTVVKNNSYVNNYNNSSLSVNAKNSAYEIINSKFTNPSNTDALWDGLINSETPPQGDNSFAAWRNSEEGKKLREQNASVVEFPVSASATVIPTIVKVSPLSSPAEVNLTL